MPSISQVRGMLLEEAMLALLRVSGYKTIERAGNDPTLHDGPSGLEVKGRGGVHQIDAVADFAVSVAFTNPLRLLLEAKCYSNTYPVGLPVIRNAVGVLKDSAEYWIASQGGNGQPHRARYHYQYAVFSASGYTEPAERYAFAQDIYLIPLSKSGNIHVVIDSIRNVDHRAFGSNAWNAIDINLGELRRAIRDALRRGVGGVEYTAMPESAYQLLEDFLAACRQIQGALMAMLGKRFPVLLVPSPGLNLEDLLDRTDVRIRWDDQAWYLYDTDGNHIFSFDLPPVLFEMYAENGVLSQQAALDLKGEALRDIQAIHMMGDIPRVLTFSLDWGWLQEAREVLRTIRR